VAAKYSIGIEFNAKSIRVAVINIQGGRVTGQSEHDYAVKKPVDWLRTLSVACREAVQAADISVDQVVGMGACFMSGIIASAPSNGTPIRLLNESGQKPGDPGEQSPSRSRVELELDAGDWLVWQLVSGPFPSCRLDELIFSKCLAGFKKTGQNLPGRLVAPGERAGLLSNTAAQLLGLRAGIPVSAASLATHAIVPGCGVASPSTMVLNIGRDSVHLMNSRIEKGIEGIAGPVEDGILPGYNGYQADQARVGMAIDWVIHLTGLSQKELEQRAAIVEPGSGGVRVNGSIRRAELSVRHCQSIEIFTGMTTTTHPEQLYRAMIESTAFDLKIIVEQFRETGIPCRRFCATGDMAARSSLLPQIYSDVLDVRIHIPESTQPAVLGAATLGCLAAGPEATGHASLSQTIHAMARWREDIVYRPDLKSRRAYQKLYNLFL
jgi:L-ribulokinase